MILTGLARLGKDAEIRYTPEGTAVANLSLAYNYGKKDNDGKRPTQWINAALWGERAEKAVLHLLKGTLLNVVLDDVYIETYDRRDGGTGTVLKARLNNFEFAGAKPKDGDASAEPREAAEKPAKKDAKKPAGKFDDMGDDIPF